MHKSAVLLATLVALAGCGNDNAAAPAPSASALASSTAQVSKTLVKMVIDPSGSATFDMKAPQENIRGTVKGFGGELDVELADIAKSRGKITIDLTTLETRTFGEDAKDQTQTEHARTWMEVGAKTSPDKREKYKLAEFAIREIVNPSVTNVTTMSGNSRDVTLTAKGDFSLHGRSVALALDLSCAFQFDGTTLKHVAIKSTKPALVSLKAHDIQARDDLGEVVIAKTLELFGKKVADDASVTFELTAWPKDAKRQPLSPPVQAVPTGSAIASASPSASASASAKAVP